MLESFSGAVERAMELAVERDSWPRKGKLYVSDLKHAVPLKDGGDCKRKLRAKLDDEPSEPISDGVSLMFKTGDMIHEKIAKWLHEHMAGMNYDLKEVETRASLPIPMLGKDLRGRLDMLFEDPSGNTYVVDVKTKRGGAFQYPPLSHGEAKRPDELQVQAYMMARDADGGCVLYVDREGQNWIKAVPVGRDDEAVKGAMEVLAGIKLAEKSQIPLVEPKVTRNKNKGPDSIKVGWPWQVEYCNLQTCHCKEDFVGGTLPSGICAYVDDDGYVEMKDGYEHRQDLRRLIQAHVSQTGSN